MITHKIRARAKILGLPIPIVARLAGVPVRTLQHWFKTGNYPATGLAKLAPALGVSPEWFRSGLDDVAVGTSALLEGARL